MRIPSLACSKSSILLCKLISANNGFRSSTIFVLEIIHQGMSLTIHSRDDLSKMKHSFRFSHGSAECLYLDTIRKYDMSRSTKKPTICLCENKGADQLRGSR